MKNQDCETKEKLVPELIINYNRYNTYSSIKEHEKEINRYNLTDDVLKELIEDNKNFKSKLRDAETMTINYTMCGKYRSVDSTIRFSTY